VGRIGTGRAMIEIGTSAGYSALWLAQACRVSGQSLTTFEILPEKARLARETFDRTGVTDVIRLVEGDYLDHADEIREVAFCFSTPKRTCTSPVTT